MFVSFVATRVMSYIDCVDDEYRVVHDVQLSNVLDTVVISGE